MQLIKKNNPNAGYETGDLVLAVDDAQLLGSGELDSSVFTIETGQTVSQEQVNLLEMTDEAPTNFSAISQLPTFRSLSTGIGNMSVLHRRKYQWSGGQAVLKPNAQER